MKRFAYVLLLALVSVTMNGQEKEKMFGVDHNKKIIVETGRLAEGEALKQIVKFRGEDYSYYRSEMPLITITTDGPIINSPAVHGIINVADADGNVITMHAGFKIRGTSSQQYEKKSYRVELWADETGVEMADTTFLGLRSDDDWNLEAMWAQPLRLRDKIANELWMDMYRLPYQENEPEAKAGIRMVYADVFINEEYMGVYTLTERVDRKQLGLKKYNGELRGLLYKGNGPGAPTYDSLPAYDNTLDTWANYEWVYPNESDTAINWDHLYSFTNFVINATDNVFYSQYSAQFDKENAIDYYLFINSLMAMDNMGRNLFLARYKKSGSYFYVPWDLDAIWGLDTYGNQTNNAEGLMSNGFYDRLIQDCNDNGFVASAQNRYQMLRGGVLTKEHIMELVQSQYDELLESGAYAREHEAWPAFTVDEDQLAYMDSWLEARFDYLDAEINAGCGTWEVEEKPGGLIAEVYPNPAKDGIHVCFVEDGAASLKLYDMMGRLVYSVSLNTRNTIIPTSGLSRGVYALVTFAGGKQQVDRVVVEK